MPSKYTKVGVIWKGQPNKNGEEMPHSLKFEAGFVPKPNAFYQFHSQKWKQTDLAQKVAKGWINDAQQEKASAAIENMSPKIVAEIIEVITE
jgi:hypothetical protein